VMGPKFKDKCRISRVETMSKPYQAHPSHRPNRLYSCNVHSRLSLPSFSFSFSLPLSRRLIAEELLDVLGLGVNVDLGGDPEIGIPREGEPKGVFDVPELGSARRYQPPVYVSAMSWYTVADPRASAPSGVGVSIHPTAHLSSSATSAVGDRGEGAEIEMCEDCVGIRY